MDGFTPGPWTVEECSHGGGLLKRGAQGGPGTHIQSSIQILPIEDARLIAAAPELLAAARLTLAAFGSIGQDVVGWGAEYGALASAVAKAEGR